MRLVLAATLSSVYGNYSGYELCEHAAIPGTEEYLDSEKYEIKVRDWEAPGNLTAYITRVNAIRRANPALQEYGTCASSRATTTVSWCTASAAPTGPTPSWWR